MKEIEVVFCGWNRLVIESNLLVNGLGIDSNILYF